MRRTTSIGIALAVALALLGCGQKDDGGPAERAGKAIDKGLAKAGEAVEKAGQNLQEASKGDGAKK
jgi:hypothetical protein